VIVAVLGSTDLWGDARRLVAHAFGETVEPSSLIVATRARSARGKAARAVTVMEGDDDGIGATRAGRRVHLASVDKSYRQPDSDAEDTRSHYTVRLGPYANRKEAEAARSRLAKRGYRARVVGQAVMIGEFTSRAGADKLAKSLRVKGYRPMIAAVR
jgi:hypothetical protein